MVATRLAEGVECQVMQEPGGPETQWNLVGRSGIGVVVVRR